MEDNMAILIADLSGYTALTETHGASAAADIVEKYLDIVQDSLVGDSRLHERTGDEVMIVSTSADFLLATANNLIQYSSAQNNFLQVHGGLHYGKILTRNNNYFGTTLNLTARIAKNAGPGSFWCSREYVSNLQQPTHFAIHSKGKQAFKNVREEHEVYELVSTQRTVLHVDPVCKMLVDSTTSAIPHPAQPNIFFCHQGCLDIYQGDELN